jgi:hypothetical protein
MNFGRCGVLVLSCVVAVSAHAQSTVDVRQAPASATTSPEGTEASEAAAAENGAIAGEDKEKQVCRRETVTGSRFTQRVCMSEADWAELRRATKAALRDAESRPQNPYRDEGN